MTLKLSLKITDQNGLRHKATPLADSGEGLEEPWDKEKELLDREKNFSTARKNSRIAKKNF